MICFEKNVTTSDEVFDFEWNSYYFSSLVLPGGEKMIFLFFARYDVIIMVHNLWALIMSAFYKYLIRKNWKFFLATRGRFFEKNHPKIFLILLSEASLFCIVNFQPIQFGSMSVQSQKTGKSVHLTHLSQIYTLSPTRGQKMVNVISTKAALEFSIILMNLLMNMCLMKVNFFSDYTKIWERHLKLSKYLWWLLKKDVANLLNNFTPTLSGLEILYDAIFFIQNWVVYRLFANIFHPKFADDNFRFFLFWK